MIREFVDKFMAGKEQLHDKLSQQKYPDYLGLVQAVIEIINPDDEYHLPDPTRITEINYGDYQGTLVFVIGASGYQPSEHWYVRVGYGSCSGCDTPQSVCDSDDESRKQGLETLCLHIVQGLKSMDDDRV